MIYTKFKTCERRKEHAERTVKALGLTEDNIWHDIREIEPKYKDKTYSFNCAKGWESFRDIDCDYCMFMDDDLEFCDGFFDICEQAVKAHPDCVFSLFPYNYIGKTVEFNDSPYYGVEFATGACIIIPKKYLDGICKALYVLSDRVKEDDDIISTWCNRNKVQIITVLPSLIQHIGDESLCVPGTPVRRTQYFEKNPKADWSAKKINGYTVKPYNIAIVQVYDNNIKDYAIYSQLGNGLYASKKGYTYCSWNYDLTPTHYSVFYNKIVGILNAMESNGNFDWILYLDSDAMVTNHDVNIEDIIDRHPGKELILGYDENGTNNGVFLIKNTPTMRAYMKNVYTDTRFFHTEFPEQTAMLEIAKAYYKEYIGLEPQMFFNGYLNVYKSFKPVEKYWNPDSFTLHLARGDNDLRVKIFTDILKKYNIYCVTKEAQRYERYERNERLGRKYGKGGDSDNSGDNAVGIDNADDERRQDRRYSDCARLGTQDVQGKWLGICKDN